MSNKIQNNSWLTVQQNAHDTVVQLFSKISKFNWFVPFRSPEQFVQYGTAFFINSEGYLLTNFHMVDEAVGLQIQIPSVGKEQFDVEIVGIHPGLDLALLRLKESELAKVRHLLGEIPFLELGDSDQVYRTQEILALGFPLGQQGLKSTQGIVSGKEKINLRSYIQITAPLNPGSSGGPSLNIKGEVIGINFAGILLAQSVGYIIPINEVKSAIKDLCKVPLLRRPYLGAIFSIANQDMIKWLKNPDEGGFYVASLIPHSMLQKTGVEEGDMIYEMNGFRVDRYGEISVPWSEDKISIFDLLTRYVVGDTIVLVVYRKGKKLEFKFNLEKSEILPVRYMYPKYEQIDFEVFGGMVLMNLALNHVDALVEHEPSFVKYHRVDYQLAPKLILTTVLPNSQADKSQALSLGDIIAEVNGAKVYSLESFRKAVISSKNTGFVSIKTEEKMFTVLGLDKIIAEDDALSEAYFYKKSSLLTKF